MFAVPGAVLNYTVWAESGIITGGGGALAATGRGALGIISHATKYPMNAGTKGMGSKTTITHSRRTIDESISKYSAIPPHTPAILQSVVDRISRLAARGGLLGETYCLAPQ